jgi:hypothetical protein
MATISPFSAALIKGGKGGASPPLRVDEKQPASNRGMYRTTIASLKHNIVSILNDRRGNTAPAHSSHQGAMRSEQSYNLPV